ncbi:site-specific DNA-methyltransferase [Rhizobium sp. 1AS11]|uniref:DNA-methyltransferase n=1 Tax=Rhizobium acaciae TaxID=2989736 RepID=UPI002222345C|nr:site-specific DNA-methyltransferase [Rhizobium acaciae]MCW1412166.1 site-specific DNA-methyltransferase [Rhizobium acaciae]MCW1744181.1 site-specific DNA-methyltransferase [Rhizobium acaciae]
MEDTTFFDGRITLKPGDCRERLKSIPDNSIDAVVTDPPYALVSIVKRFGAENAAPATPKEGSAGAYARASAGFMGKQWDTGETAFSEEFWADVLRVLKPGGHVVAFSGTRTYHRMAVAIEDAGFEIRDQAAWTYGTGFPKSHNVSKAIDKHLGVDREVIGTETVANDMRNGSLSSGWKGEENTAYTRDITAPGSPEAVEWDGWGTALKPAWEPICVARKPCAVPIDEPRDADAPTRFRPATVAENVMYWGTGALNLRACKIEAEKVTGWGGNAGGGKTWNESNSGLGKDGAPRPSEGRFPANIITDGSAEVMEAFPETQSGELKASHGKSKPKTDNIFGSFAHNDTVGPYADSGSAARFFYSAKADGDDRLGSNHPTVKPVDLMRWLVRLVCRKGGVVLDPFAGTGSTGAGAYWEGCDAILIEREAEYQADIAKRMRLILAGPDEKKRARTKLEAPQGLPLFSAL